MNLTTLKKEFIAKSKILEEAKIKLKEEFVGLDSIIDEIIDVMSSWYTLNFIQDKPLIVNLWGLTGVGKTSLINRITELVKLEHSYYRFDLGDKSGQNSFHNKISDLCDNKEDNPIIIALDEFQHARTLKGPFREEIENDLNRKVWDLIDSGKVNYFSWSRGIWDFKNDIKKMTFLLRSGVVVENGIVIKNAEFYCTEMNETYDKKNPTLFIAESMYSDIIEYAGLDFNLIIDQNVRDLVLKMDGHKSIEFLLKVFKLSQKPSVKFFTKSLIFILGNIDEAYTMSGNFSADIDADEFHIESLKIKIPKIKSVLRARFRDEQIARLGNIHIIYPALSRNAYSKIIKIEIEKNLEFLGSTLLLKYEFDNSLVETIYNEGVYPVQGVRPIFTTIQHLLKSKLSFFVLEMIKEEKEVDKISFSVKDSHLICSYYFESEIIFVKNCQLTLNLEKIRKNRKDDLQSIVAVHESGHAVLFGILLNQIPDMAFSVTSDDDSLGFVYTSNNKEFFSKKEMLPHIACLLGGCIAEEIIFGADNVTSGSGSDIEKATKLVMNCLKKDGFGNEMISYAKTQEEVNLNFHSISNVENEAISILKEARKIAFNTLNCEKELLLVLSNYLSNNTSINKQQLKIMFDVYSVTKINQEEFKFYRNKLIKEYDQIIGEDSAEKKLKNLLPFNLNKDKTEIDS